MKKKGNNKWWKILAALVLLAAMGAVLWSLSDKIFRSGYDPSAATSVKFEKIKEWIPAENDFVIVADVSRALLNENVKEKLSNAAADSEDGVSKDIARALLSNSEAVGMAALLGKFGQGKQSPDIAVILQGNFDEGTLVSSVRTILTAGRAGLAAEKIGDNTIYMESDSRDPFAFVLFDREHIAIGSRASLAALFFKKDGKDEELPAALPKDQPYPVIFGNLKLGQKVAGALPDGMPPIDSIRFESADGVLLLASIPCADAVQAEKLRMFLEGVRSLLIIQEEANTTLASILKNLSIAASDSNVTIQGGI